MTIRTSGSTEPDSLPLLLLFLVAIPAIVALAAGTYFASLPPRYAATTTIKGELSMLARANHGAATPVSLSKDITDSFTVLSVQTQDAESANAAIFDFLNRGKAMPFYDEASRQDTLAAIERGRKLAAQLTRGLDLLEKAQDSVTLSAADSEALEAISTLATRTIDSSLQAAGVSERNLDQTLIGADVDPPIRIAFSSGNWIAGAGIAGSFAFVVMLLFVLERRQKPGKTQASTSPP